jgi:TatD DNase family protein
VIDFHCHLDLYPNPQQVMRECVKRGLYMLSVTTTPSAWAKTAALASDAPRIRTSLGLHPQLAHQRKSELTMFENLLPDTKYVGEIGLDGDPGLKSEWEDQVLVFDRILHLCQKAGGRILSVHSRRSAAAVLDLLGSHRRSGIPVLHWFSGTIAELRRAIDLGCWFSVGPAMLSSAKGTALVANMPHDRLLTESDGPFAQLDGRAIQPWDAGHAQSALAQMWNESSAAVEEQLLANLRHLVSGP